MWSFPGSAKAAEVSEVGTQSSAEKISSKISKVKMYVEGMEHDSLAQKKGKKEESEMISIPVKDMFYDIIQYIYVYVYVYMYRSDISFSYICIYYIEIYDANFILSNHVEEWLVLAFVRVC